MKIEKSVPTLIKTRLETFSNIDKVELIVDFDNDRHHAFEYEKGMTRKEFVRALRGFAMSLEADTHLDRKRVLVQDK